MTAKKNSLKKIEVMDLRKLLKDHSVYFECVEFGNLIFENNAFIANKKLITCMKNKNVNMMF